MICLNELFLLEILYLYTYRKVGPNSKQASLDGASTWILNVQSQDSICYGKLMGKKLMRSELISSPESRFIPKNHTIYRSIYPKKALTLIPELKPCNYSSHLRSLNSGLVSFPWLHPIRNRAPIENRFPASYNCP